MTRENAESEEEPEVSSGEEEEEEGEGESDVEDEGLKSLKQPEQSIKSVLDRFR